MLEIYKMDIEISKLVIPAIVGLLSGIFGTFFAPWVNWGIEKKKLIRQERKELLSQCREVLSEDISFQEFRLHTIYSKIRPYLSSVAIKTIEGDSEDDVETTTIVMGNGRHSGINPFRQKILDELTHQERVWGLI